MASKRSYQDGLSDELIVEEFKRCRGTQFDPVIVDVMIALIESGEIHEPLSLEFGG